MDSGWKAEPTTAGTIGLPGWSRKVVLKVKGGGRWP